MKTRYLFTIILLALALPAAAEFRTIQRAYEVELSNLRLPQAEGGTIAFKPCSNCAYQTTRVTVSTRWVLNGQSMSLAKFREGIAGIEVQDRKSVTVLHHLEDDRVTRVAITIR